MATKPLQMDDEGRVMDEETRKNQKAYEAYEREQSDAQRKLEERDKRMMEGARKIKEKIKSVIPFKKGGVAKKTRVKRYQYGGTIGDNYPFQSDTSSSLGTSGVNQTFNIQPSAQAGQPSQMKRGGMVKSASKRADGCAIRGKTRA